MILVLFLCAIAIFSLLVFFIFIFSTLKIEAKNLEISNIKEVSEYKNNIKIGEKVKNKVKSNYSIILSLNLINKFKILQIKLNNTKIKNISLKMHLDRINIKEIEKKMTLQDIDSIKKIKPQISYLNLCVKIGVEDILLTTYAIPLVSTAISIFLPFVVEKNDKDRIKYVVNPIYNRGNVYDIKLNIDIKIKILRLLNACFSILKRK